MRRVHELPGGAGHVGAQRAGLAVLCAALTAIAVGNGLDRAAATTPSLGRFVPSAFATFSLIARGTEAVRLQRFSEAEAIGRAAVNAAPIEPESAAILGAARLGLERPGEAEQAFVVAGQFGWRTPLTQYYWMQQALALGDTRVAALRLDAMLRQDPELVANPALMAPLESTEPGRQALAQRLSEQPGWLTKYATGLSEVPPAGAAIRADVFDILAGAGKPLGCNSAGPIATTLVQAGSVARAYSFWQRHCPERANGLVSDPQFSALQTHQPDSPFDWIVIGDSDVSLSVDPVASRGQGRRLMIASSASFPRKVLTQLSPLPPGRYQFQWSARTEAGVLSERLKASVACAADSRDWLPAKANRVQNVFTADFVVDGACPARWISFSILPGQDALSLGDIEFRAIR